MTMVSQRKEATMIFDKYFVKWSVIVLLMVIVAIAFSLSVFGRLDDYWFMVAPASFVAAVKLADEDRKGAP